MQWSVLSRFFLSSPLLPISFPSPLKLFIVCQLLLASLLPSCSTAVSALWHDPSMSPSFHFLSLNIYIYIYIYSPCFHCLLLNFIFLFFVQLSFFSFFLSLPLPYTTLSLLHYFLSSVTSLSTQFS